MEKSSLRYPVENESFMRSAWKCPRIPTQPSIEQDLIVQSIVGAVAGAFTFLRDCGQPEEAERFASWVLASIVRALAQVRAA